MQNKELNFIFRMIKHYGKWLITVITTTVAATLFVIELSQDVNDIKPRVDALESRFSEFEKTSAMIHNDILAKTDENSKKFELVTLKLETTLSQISTDLQFIKQKLLEKSLQ